MQGILGPFPDGIFQRKTVQNAEGDGKIDATGGLGQGVAVGQAGDFMNILHGSLGFCDMDAVFLIQHESHGQDPHQRAVAVFVHLVAAAQSGSYTLPVAVDGPGAGIANVKPFSAWAVGPVAAPVIKPCHDVVGMIVAHLADTVRQTKGHAAVIGPITGRLAMNAAAHHFCDGVLLQIRPCPALRRYAQGVRYAQAVYSISDG